MNLLLQACDLRIKSRDLTEKKGPRLAYRLPEARPRLLKRQRQPADMHAPLRRDNAKLRQVATQRVDRLRALAHQKIARADHVWCADITYIPVSCGFLYRVAIMGWASRFVVPWHWKAELQQALAA